MIRLTQREPGKTGCVFTSPAEAEKFHRSAIECGTFCSRPVEVPFAGVWAVDWWPPYQSESIHGEALLLDAARTLVGEVEAIR